MNVFIIGGTGYVGRQILRDLVNAGHQVTCLLRNGSEKKIPDECTASVQMIPGDLEDEDSLRKGIRNAEAVIYLPGLVREFPTLGLTNRRIVLEGAKRVIDLAVRNNVKKFLLMSANGVKSGSGIGYQESKYEAEEYLKRSNLLWTIFRPSIIFGNESEGLMNFIQVIKDLLTLAPFVVPVIGDGKYRFQPISIYNVSEGFIKSLTHTESQGKTYHLGGPEMYSYNEILEIVGEIYGTKKIKIHQPLFLMKPLIHLMETFPFFPISTAQLNMLLEENIVPDWKRYFNDLRIHPISFREGLKKSTSQ